MKSATEIWREAEEARLSLPQSSLDLTNDLYVSGIHTLRTLYKKIILCDLDYSLDKKVEQELWNICFKVPISRMQALPAKDGRIARKLEPLLSWFLESASGFYQVLLQEICARFDLDFSFSKPNARLGIISHEQPAEVKPKVESCFYICQHCLIHLGDLARYQNNPEEAEGYYKEAILVEPSSGHPYNQLALLEAARGDRLSTMFYYIRSLSLRHPFPPARTNLEKLMKKQISTSITYKMRSKLNVDEFISSFLKLQAQVELRQDLDQAEQIGHLLSLTLAPLIATESLTLRQIIQMQAICMHAAQTNGSNSLTGAEKRAHKLSIDLAASILNACLVSAYSLQGDQLPNYHLMPAIKLAFNWLHGHGDILLKESIFNRTPLWSAACKVLNQLGDCLSDLLDPMPDEGGSLPDEVDWLSFTPLRSLHPATPGKLVAADHVTKIRISRIVQIGVWLATQSPGQDRHCMTMEDRGQQTCPRYVFKCSESQPAVPSTTPAVPSTAPAASDQDAVPGKRTVLKEVTILTRKPRNVALAAILKQNTDDSKQTAPASSEAPSAVSDVGKRQRVPAGSTAAATFVPSGGQVAKQATLQQAAASSSVAVPPGADAATAFLNGKLSSQPRPWLAPRLGQREQKDRDMLNNLGLYSGFGTSFTPVAAAAASSALPPSSEPTNISIPPPPTPPSIPPPGMGFPNAMMMLPSADGAARPQWPNFQNLPPFSSSAFANHSYSLFSSPAWHSNHPTMASTASPALPAHLAPNVDDQQRLNMFNPARFTNQQAPLATFGSGLLPPPSLWSGPGPSPLERLLEQQKSMRGGSPAKNQPM